MKLSVKGIAVTSGLMWGGAVATVGLINRVRPEYGREFLRLVGSIYPGYHGRATGADLATGIAYAVLDGMIGGAAFATIYNQFDNNPADQKTLKRAA